MVGEKENGGGSWCGRNFVSQILRSKRFRKTEPRLLVSVNRTDREKKLFRKPERIYVIKVLLKWFKQQRSDNVPVSGPVLMITLVFPKF